MAERSTRELRKFGLLVGGIFLLLGCYSFWRGHTWRADFLWTVGVGLVVPGVIAPALLAPVQRGWMRFGEVAGHFNARVILTVLFYLVVTPIGLVLRWFKDPLDRTIADGRSSEWIVREPQAADLARYREQF